MGRRWREGVLTHPMTLHLLEEHEGKQQEIIFRILGKYRSVLGRQVAESVAIKKASTKTEKCVNL